MSLNDVKVVVERDMVTLRKKLHELLCVDIKDYLLSPMNLLIVKLIKSKTEYSTNEDKVFDLFSDLVVAEQAYDVALDKRARAVIIWAGGKLSQNYVTKLHQAYLEVDEEERNDLSKAEAVAETIAKDIVHPDWAQQGLDQERIHSKAVREVQSILTRFVGDRVSVYVPPDTALIRLTAELKLPDTAVPYQFENQERPVVFPHPPPASQYLIVVTIGHGAVDGTTWFPPVSGVVPQKIAEGLPAPQHAALCVPLQCYPQQSVALWKAVQDWAPKITSSSIESLVESDDTEMLTWIKNTLFGTIADWFYTLLQSA